MKRTMTKKEWFINSFSDEILVLIDDQDSLTRSDTQGIAMAMAINYANALEALELCKVQVFMAEGSENEAYQKARAVLAITKGWEG